MAGQIEPIARMAQQLSRLPGIGSKDRAAAGVSHRLPAGRSGARAGQRHLAGPQGGEILLDLRQLHGGGPLPDLRG